MSEVEGLSYGQVLGRIAELAEELGEHPDPKVADRVSELLDWVDAFHRDGLGRLIDMVRAWRGEIFLESVSSDEIAGTLLAAYGLGESREVEVDAADAIEAAMTEVRPTVESHGGYIEIDDVTDGVVRVRMKGTCDGCPSSSATLTYGLEASLREHWPSFRRLEVVDPAEVDPSKADLTCVSVPEPAPTPQPEPVLLQIRGHEGQ
ncbi:MAG: NifU family protein [Acidimicrobiales bacterium]